MISNEYQALLERLEAGRYALRVRAGTVRVCLDSLRGRAGEHPGRVAGTLRRGSLKVTLFACALAFPFFLLVASSVELYRHFAFPTWLALAGGITMTGALLLLYAAWGWRRLGLLRPMPRVMVRVVFGLVATYCLYSLVYLSSLNVKGDDLRSRFGSLHPLLRIATSTFILVDGELIITDMIREPADYARMGLPLYERSLHFVQADGYAHAVDLRTAGRSEWRNRLLQAYFNALGFRTLRHLGTADHLHVSLPPP
jgi:hypothetical protein